MATSAGTRGGKANPRHDRIMAAMERCPLVSGLSHDEIEELISRSKVHYFPGNLPVFTEGARCEGAWVIVAGRVRLHHTLSDGRQRVGGFRGPGAALELTSAFDGQAHMSTATTLEPSEIVLIPRALVAELGRNYPITLHNALAELCLEVRQRDITTAVASSKDARGRVGCTLLWAARQFGVVDGETTRIDYRLSRQDLADRSGVAVETAIRIMSDLQQRGVIRTNSQIIEILDIDQVRDPAQCEQCQFDCSVFASTTAAQPG